MARLGEDTGLGELRSLVWCRGQGRFRGYRHVSIYRYRHVARGGQDACGKRWTARDAVPSPPILVEVGRGPHARSSRRAGSCGRVVEHNAGWMCPSRKRFVDAQPSGSGKSFPRRSIRLHGERRGVGGWFEPNCAHPSTATVHEARSVDASSRAAAAPKQTGGQRVETSVRGAGRQVVRGHRSYSMACKPRFAWSCILCYLPTCLYHIHLVIVVCSYSTLLTRAIDVERNGDARCDTTGADRE